MAIKNIALEKIRPNPYQPASRVKVSEEDAKWFGESILRNGLFSTPFGRRTNGFFEMGDGWLRLKGYVWLVDHGHTKYQEIPFDERDLSDQQMADLVIEANKTRKDLNPIQEAEFYAKYIKDFKVPQEQLAKKYNVSQGEIANTLRLLELPTNVKEKVISQEISSTHARQLLRLNTMPKKQEEFVAATIKSGMSVAQLDTEINRDLYNHSKPLTINPRERILFDVKPCEKCPKTQMVADPWGEKKKQLRCLNPECWEKKERAAEKAQEEATKKKLEKSLEGEKVKVFTEKNLSYNQYAALNNMKELDNPAECNSCKKRGLYKPSYSDLREPEKVCLDPSCYRSKKTKHTREENKSKKEKDRALTVRLGEIFEKTSKNRYAALVIAARAAIARTDAVTRDDIAGMFDNLPKHSNGKVDHIALQTVVLKWPEPQLIKLLNAITISLKRRRNCYDGFSTELNDDVLMDIAILEGTYESRAAEIIAFQEKNCAGCGNANAALVSTGEKCCTYDYNRKIKDGVCLNSPKMRELREKKDGKPTVADTVTVTANTDGAIKRDDAPEKKPVRGGKPIVTKIDPTAQEYELNHTFRFILKDRTKRGSDVTAQDLNTALQALKLEPKDVESVKVWKSSGKPGTSGAKTTAGWGKPKETLAIPMAAAAK